VDEGHGCIEIREFWSTSDYLRCIATLADRHGLQSIAMVQTNRRLSDETTVTRRCFTSSLKSDEVAAARRTHALGH
jgi:hypothetical protein